MKKLLLAPALLLALSIGLVGCKSDDIPPEDNQDTQDVEDETGDEDSEESDEDEDDQLTDSDTDEDNESKGKNTGTKKSSAKSKKKGADSISSLEVENTRLKKQLEKLQAKNRSKDISKGGNEKPIEKSLIDTIQSLFD